MADEEDALSGGADRRGIEAGAEVRADCATECAPQFAPDRASTRRPVFHPNEKPAELAGFSVKSLVALPGIEPGF